MAAPIEGVPEAGPTGAGVEPRKGTPSRSFFLPPLSTPSALNLSLPETRLAAA